MMPLLNTMSVAGIVTLPGMMTGQILAGADPAEAAKYQIMIMFVLSGAAGLGALAAGVRRRAAAHRRAPPPAARPAGPGALTFRSRVRKSRRAPADVSRRILPTVARWSQSAIVHPTNIHCTSVLLFAFG